MNVSLSYISGYLKCTISIVRPTVVETVNFQGNLILNLRKT